MDKVFCESCVYCLKKPYPKKPAITAPNKDWRCTAPDISRLNYMQIEDTTALKKCVDQNISGECDHFKREE